MVVMQRMTPQAGMGPVAAEDDEHHDAGYVGPDGLEPAAGWGCTGRRDS